MLEVKELLVDLEGMGASITLKDGAPRLHGKVDADTMKRIKSLRSEIVAFLSEPPQEAPKELFKVAPIAKSAIDVVGKEVKVKKKLEVVQKKALTMVVGQCSCCAKPINGYLSNSEWIDDIYIWQREGMFYCHECEYLLVKIEEGEKALLALKSRTSEPITQCVTYKSVKCDTCFEGTIRKSKGLDKEGNAIVELLQCMECDGMGRKPC